MPPTEQETAGPIERYLIHRANEAAVAAKPSMWDNLLRDLLPKSTPAAKAATKFQAHYRGAKARRLSAAAAAERTAELAAVEAKSFEARRLQGEELAAAVKAHDLAEAKAKAGAADKARLEAAAKAKAAEAQTRLVAAEKAKIEAEAKTVAAADLEKARQEQAPSTTTPPTTPPPPPPPPPHPPHLPHHRLIAGVVRHDDLRRRQQRDSVDSNHSASRIKRVRR